MQTRVLLNTIDIIVLVVVLLVPVLIGIYHGFRNKIRNFLFKSDKTIKSSEENVNDYLIANSSMSSWPIAFSLLVSFQSSISFLGVPAEVFQYGIQYWISVLGMMITPLIGAYITGPFFANLNIFSIFEYLELRFNSKKVKMVGVICYIIKCFISTAIYIFAPATALSALTNLSENLTIGLIGLIGTFYTSVGGIKGVIWADLFQGLVIFSTLVIIVIKGSYDSGGIIQLFQVGYKNDRLNLFDFDPNPFLRQSFWSLSIGMTIYFSISYGLDQQMIQRFQAAKTKKVAQKALLLNVPGNLLYLTMLIITGLIVYFTYGKCDPLTLKEINNPNQLIGYYVINNFKSFPGFSGLFMASIFCSSLSSVSSTLGSQSALIWQDFFKPLPFFQNCNDSKSITINKAIVLVCGFLSTGLAFTITKFGGNLIQISLGLNGSFIAPLIGLFALGFFFSNTNSVGAISGTILGFLGGLFLSLGAYVVKPSYPKLDVSLESCSNTSYTNLTVINSKPPVPYGFKKIFYLSHMWYGTFGILLTIGSGLLISFFTSKKQNKLNYKYIYFDLLGFFKKKTNSVEADNFEHTTSF